MRIPSLRSVGLIIFLAATTPVLAKSPADWHNTGLTVIQEDIDHLTQEWTCEAKGRSGKTVFRFTRARQGGSG